MVSRASNSGVALPLALLQDNSPDLRALEVLEVDSPDSSASMGPAYLVLPSSSFEPVHFVLGSSRSDRSSQIPPIRDEFSVDAAIAVDAPQDYSDTNG